MLTWKEVRANLDLTQKDENEIKYYRELLDLEIELRETIEDLEHDNIGIAIDRLTEVINALKKLQKQIEK